MTRKFRVSKAFVVLALVLTTFSFLSDRAASQGIEQLLIENVPVPKPRPKRVETSIDVASSQASVQPSQAPVPTSGSLKQGLAAIDDGEGDKALSIMAGMAEGSLEKKIMAWSIALSGNSAIDPGTLATLSAKVRDWPSKKALRTNYERSIGRAGLSPRQVIAAFAGGAKSPQGAAILAKAHLSLGQKKKANQAIAPFWRNERLDKGLENYILRRAGDALTLEDHRFRMHRLLYKDRITAANRVAPKAKQESLARARAAVIRKSSKAKSLLGSVALSSQKDPAYLFSRIAHARRTENFSLAAELLLKAPADPAKLVDPGEWWVERRIVSRKMLEEGKNKLAYRLVAEHASTEARDIAEAEFHAGWYALRFLRNRKLAKKHFSRILSVSKTPISLSRGHYWMGRASKGSSAREHFQQAASFRGTFYGQLAAAELRVRNLNVKPVRASAKDRKLFRQRELVQAKELLENAGSHWRANVIVRHLARTLNSPGELAILAARAERDGDHNLSLQIGKIAYGRGIDVGGLAWPLGAIPRKAKIADTGKALAYSIARQESAFIKTAVSPANARGLLQLLPGTAKSIAKRNGMKYSFKRLTQDAAYNATLGAAYLSEQLENFDNSYVLTFAAYNAGPGRVSEWIERFGDPRKMQLYEVIDWIEQIPFTETRHYVQRIMENYQVYKSRISKARLNIAEDLTRGRR